MKSTRHETNSNPVIFPASLLKDDGFRLLVAQSSSSGYLLVSQDGNLKQAKIVRRLKRILTRRGVKVSILSL